MPALQTLIPAYRCLKNNIYGYIEWVNVGKLSKQMLLGKCNHIYNGGSAWLHLVVLIIFTK